MKIKEQHSFKASDVSKLLGIKPEIQRDRRRRGSIYFGMKNEAGQWMYSARDMIGMAISEALFPCIGDLFEAERAGNWCAAEVAKHLGINHPEVWEVLPREVVASGETQDMGIGFKYMLFVKGRNPRFTNNPSRCGDFECSVFFVVNLQKVAEEIPPKLLEVVRERLAKK